MTDRLERSGHGERATRIAEPSLDLSIVIPVFNEEDNVGLLHRELDEVLTDLNLTCEIVFVDDGSTDRTVACLRDICAGDERVRAIRFSRNFGQSVALQAGFDHARGRVVVTLDGDLQNDPKDIPRLLQALDEGFDVVSGWRYERQDKKISRLLPSKVANWLIRKLTGVPINDNGCTLKAYRSEVIRRSRLYSDRHRFLVAVLTQSGGRVREMKVNHRERLHGKSKYGLSRIWKVVLDLLSIKMLLRFAAHPSAWFALLSFPFLVLATLSGGLSLYYMLAADIEASGRVVFSSVTMLFAFTAVNLLLIGMFAEVVVRFGDYSDSDPLIAEVVTR